MQFVELTQENFPVMQKMAPDIFPEAHEKALSDFAKRLGPDHQKALDQAGLAYADYFIITNDPNPDEHMGKPVGMIGKYAYKAHPNEIGLGWFGILPDERGKKLATQALEKFEQDAVANDKDTLRIWTTLVKSDEGAVKLYEHLGMERAPFSDDVPVVVVFSKGLKGNKPTPWPSLENRPQIPSGMDTDTFRIAHKISSKLKNELKQNPGQQMPSVLTNQDIGRLLSSAEVAPSQGREGKYDR